MKLNVGKQMKTLLYWLDFGADVKFFFCFGVHMMTSDLNKWFKMEKKLKKFSFLFTAPFFAIGGQKCEEKWNMSFYAGLCKGVFNWIKL